MRIHIKSKDHTILVPMPTNLIFSKGTVQIASWAFQNKVDNYMEGVSEESLDQLFAEFRRIKHKHGHWTLVEVHSADGQEVTVIL